MKKFTPHAWFLWTSLPFLFLQTVISLTWSTPSVSPPLHDTYLVFSNSQLLSSFAGLLVFIAVIYFVMKKMNRYLHNTLSIIHYVCTIISVLIMTVGLLSSGFFIRSNNPALKPQLFDYQILNRYIAVGGFILLFGQVVFVFNCLYGLFWRKLTHQ